MRTRRGAVLGAVGLLAFVFAYTPSSGARPDAPAVSAVVMSGGLAPWTTIRGGRLTPTGKLQTLLVRRQDRGSGHVTVGPTLSLTPQQRNTIAAAAQAVLSAPRVQIDPNVDDGSYAAAAVKVGTKTRTVIGVNKTSPALRALVQAVNGALPGSARLQALPPSLPSVAKKLMPPVPASCPDDQEATSIGKEISLKEAAAAGIVKLTSKGKFEGDAVAVDATWKPTKKPWKIKINVEVTPPPNTYPESGGWDAAIKKKIESGIGTQTAFDGQPVKVEASVRVRGAAPPTPCFHQVVLTDDPDVRSTVFDGGAAAGKPVTGLWSLVPPGPGEKIGAEYAHEAMHLAGLDDQYDDLVVAGGKTYPVPRGKFANDNDPALLEWAKQNKISGTPVLIGRPKPGHANDLMADLGKRFINPLELNALLKSHPYLLIHGSPGDLLLEKRSSEQNLGVGAPLDLLVRPGKPAHVDGLVAYCIDIHRGIPKKGDGFDVLGPAADQGGAAMQALQRVLEAIGRRSVPGDPDPFVSGAQGAIWHVTDNELVWDEDAEQILAEAGVAPDATFSAPHFDDPNAASPTTAAVTPAAVLPHKNLPPGPKPGPPPKPRLAKLSVQPRLLRARRASVLAVRIVLEGVGTRVMLQVRRAGIRGKTFARRRLPLPLGDSLVGLRIRPLPPGRYGLTASGTFKSRSASLVVER